MCTAVTNDLTMMGSGFGRELTCARDRSPASVIGTEILGPVGADPFVVRIRSVMESLEIAEGNGPFPIAASQYKMVFK